MAPGISMESEVERVASSNLELAEMASSVPPSKTSFTPTHSKARDQTQCLENKNTDRIINSDDDTNKDYYAKFEEDSKFRNFVENLLRSSSTKNLKICKKDKIDELFKNSDTIDGNTETVINMEISPTKREPKTNRNKGTAHKNNLHSSTTKTSNTKDTLHKSSKTAAMPMCNDDISYPRGQYKEMVRDRRLNTRNGLGMRNETGNCSENCGKDARVKKDQENSGEFGFNLGVSKSRSYSTLPRMRASVVLREKHLSLTQAREECTKSGVFTMPRVSCYHRSTLI